MSVLPAVFFGHGNPMNTLEKNRYTEAWRAFGQAIPRPRTIHDFFGFPPVRLAVDDLVHGGHDDVPASDGVGFAAPLPDGPPPDGANI